MKLLKMLFIGILIIVIVCLTSCDPVNFIYSKDYSGFDLHQVAVYNAPGGEVPISLVEPIEEDSYGRILFSYIVDDDSYPIFAYVICQRTDENYVYYYEDDCVLVYKDSSFLCDQALLYLKTKNDWEQPFSEDKCVRKNVLKQYRAAKYYNTVEGFECQDSLRCHNKIEEILRRNVLHDQEYDFVLCYYAGMDNDGRMLYYAKVSMYPDSKQYDENSNSQYYAIILNKDLTCEDDAYIFIDDFYQSTEKIQELKQLVGWNV